MDAEFGSHIPPILIHVKEPAITQKF